MKKHRQGTEPEEMLLPMDTLNIYRAIITSQ